MDKQHAPHHTHITFKKPMPPYWLMAYYSNESTIIAQPFIFSEDYIPDHLVGRDKELRHLTDILGPATAGKKPPHIWLTGPSGSGKTSLVHAALTKLGRRVGDDWLRINCAEDPTSYLALERMCRELRVLRAEQQSASIKLQRLSAQWGERPFILVLDEVDMMAPKQRSDLLYLLSNVSKVGLIAIAYHRTTFAELDRRVRSRMSPEMLHLRRYPDASLAAILEHRAQLGLQSDAWNEKLLKEIVGRAEQDARLAVKILGRVAQHAERARSSTITEDHLKSVTAALEDIRLLQRTRHLNPHQILIQQLVVQAKEITSPDIRKSYVEQCKERKLKPVASRTFLVYLNRLVNQKLVEEEYVVDQRRMRVFRPVSGARGHAESGPA